MEEVTKVIERTFALIAFASDRKAEAQATSWKHLTNKSLMWLFSSQFTQ